MTASGGHRAWTSGGNVFACLVHESFECVADLVRNLNHLDPSSQILLYNGGGDRMLLPDSAWAARYGAVVHPAPRPMQWGRLHDFAFDCLEFALANLDFRALTVVDSDQMLIRKGYSDAVAGFLASRPRVGLLGSLAAGEGGPPGYPAMLASAEHWLWEPFLARFDGRHVAFPQWSLWGGTVITREAAHDLVELRSDPELDGILTASGIVAIEEVLFPTLVALLGYGVEQSPCSYDYVRWGESLCVEDVDAAMADTDVYWVHPVPRSYDDPLRKHVRQAFNHYEPYASSIRLGECRAPRAEHGRAGPEVSVVVPVHNEGERLFLTLEALGYSTDVRHEVIVVDDGSTDSCCDMLASDGCMYEHVRLVREERQGVATAKNVGAREATAPVVVFLDAHCFPRRGWLDSLLSALDRVEAGLVAPCLSVAGDPSLRGFGMTIVDSDFSVEWLPKRGESPYEVPIAGGGCMAMRADFFEQLGGFDTMRSFGVEDVEFCIRSWLFGCPVVVVPEADVAHCFKGESNFSVGWVDYMHNLLRAALLHLDGDRLDRVLTRLRPMPEYGEALDMLVASDIWTRWSFVREGRTYDADWLCNRFELAL